MGITRLSLEDLACVLILMFFGIAGAIPGIAPNQASEMTGAPASGLMFVAGIGSQLLVNAIMVVLALCHASRVIASLRSLHFAGVLAVFAVVSAAWSQEPVLTLRRALPFCLATLFALYLATRRTPERTLALFETSFLLLAAGSAVLALGFPALGLDASTGHGGDWQGVFTQKNACGRAMVFASAVVLARGKFTLGRAASLAVFLGVLAMSGSRGAWVIEALLLTAALFHGLLVHLERPGRIALAWLILVGGAASALLAKLYFPLLARLLGRDPTLTGRTEIWAQVWVAILKRPWLGYGFSAFWRGTRGASFDVIVALKFVLFHAHNGLLEVWLELGAAGLLFFLLSYLRSWQRLWPLLLADHRGGLLRATAWPLYVLLLIAAYDLDENTLLSFNGLFWVLYVHALTSIELLAGRAARPVEVMQDAPTRRWPSEPLWTEPLAGGAPWR